MRRYGRRYNRVMKKIIKIGVAFSVVFTIVTTVSAAGEKQIYACDNAGGRMYGDACAPAAKEKVDHQPMSTMSPPSTEAAKLAKQYDAEAAHDLTAKRKADAAWLKQHDAEKARQAAIDKGLAEHHVVKGMTPQQVRSILNEPDRIENKGGEKERWIYNEAGHHQHVVTFENGVVVSDGGRGSKRK
jgi:hypothetical protein